MAAAALKFLNVTSRCVRHRCLRNMSATATEVSDKALILEKTNPHKMDARMTFSSGSQCFRLDNVDLVHGIPEIVENAFKKFNADEAVKKMMAAPSWPRQPYIKKDGKAYSALGVKMKWKQDTAYKKELGLKMIENVHLVLNGKEPEQFRELSNFEVFRNEVIQEKGIQPHRTLWQIGAGAARVHGVVHFLGKFDDGTYALIDWDGNKILRDRLKNAFGTAAEAPIAHLDDSPGTRAFLRINMKRYILQKYYDMKVSYMAVAVLSPGPDRPYDLFEAPILESEAESLIQKIK